MKSPKPNLLAHPGQPRRRPGRPSFDSAKTRNALLDAAEELFATFGVEGVSIRSVNAAAGFAPTAVHRHFGSKEGLLEAVILRRGEALAVRLCQLLDTLGADGRRPTALGMVSAWALPYRELIEHDAVGGFLWLQLLARLILARNRRMEQLSSRFGLAQRVVRISLLVFPGVPELQILRGLHIAFGTLIQMMANRDVWTAHHAKEEPGREAKTDLNRLVRFVATGLAELVAPEPKPSTRQPLRPAEARRVGR